MLQIAIWGIAIMLVVKGLDVLHQQSVATSSGHPGNNVLAIATAVIAIVGALALVVLAGEQVKSTAAIPSGGSFLSSGTTPTTDEIIANADSIADNIDAEASRVDNPSTIGDSTRSK